MATAREEQVAPLATNSAPQTLTATASWLAECIGDFALVAMDSCEGCYENPVSEE